MRPERILILGNSITRHRPKPDIGWTDDWGMAASALEKDYVHLLLARLTHAAGGKAPVSMVDNIAPFEREYPAYDISGTFKQYADFQPDCVVLAIGENIAKPDSPDSEAALHQALTTGLMVISQDTPELFVRSCFWPEAIKDHILRRVCADFHGTFVDISALHLNEIHFARAERSFSNNDVAKHPGDAGMKAIADAIFTAIKNK